MTTDRLQEGISGIEVAQMKRHSHQRIDNRLLDGMHKAMQAQGA